MTDFDRRHVMGGIVLGGGILAATGAIAEPPVIDPATIKKETEVACAYHCDFGDPARIGQMLGNINNHLSAYENDPFKLKLVVVAHAAGIKPFLTDLEGTPWSKEQFPAEIFERFDGLAKLGVDVLLCRITFVRNKIDLSKARVAPFIKLVPSGVATVAALQSKGFAYVKVG